MNKKYSSIDLGIADRISKVGLGNEKYHLGRIIAQHKDFYRVATEKSDMLAKTSGKIFFKSDDIKDLPAVGDFVLLDRDESSGGNAIIHGILERKSSFIRKAAGTSQQAQVIAANIDTIFICMALNRDFNLRRLERYLAIAWDSGACPVVVLTKADLCTDIEMTIAEVSSVAIGAEILVTSGLTCDGSKSIKKYIYPGQTVAFIGSSGVGKSTLINLLLGEEKILTARTRRDDRGRHTTTNRELFCIPGGGAVIDTPGMREIGLENADLERAFADIEELAASCHFSDCTHEKEPNCAVRRAIDEGKIDLERLMNYKKLIKEAKYEGLNSRQIEQEKVNEMFTAMGGIKNVRDLIKSRKNR